jgi:hypothetical protein
VIPPQHLTVTSEPPEDIAAYWGHMTEVAPDLYNEVFALVAAQRVN